MDDKNFKTKYTKCKWKLKKWEKEFNAKHGTNPSKEDIKDAPSPVREAYKLYYKLKTMALENSLLDATICDSTMDSFYNENLTKSETEKTDFKDIGLNHSVCSENDVNSNNKPEDSFKIEDNVPANNTKVISVANTNKDSVWGPHLNKKPLPNLSSSSLSYTAKLYPGAKFNKRNPRKSLSTTRNKKVNESMNDSLSVPHSENSLSSYEPKFLSQPLPSNNPTELLKCDLDDKIKIIKPSTPIVAQSVSLIQKTLNNTSNELLTTRSLNQGWVNRTALSNNMEIMNISSLSDSGIDVKELSLNISNRGEDVSPEDSDEDLIYDSDSEMENKNRLNTPKVSLKRSSDSFIDDRPRKICKIETFNSQSSSSPRFVDKLTEQSLEEKNDSIVSNLDNKCSFINNEPSDISILGKDIQTTASVLVQDNSSALNTNIKTNYTKSGVSLIDKCSDLLVRSESEAKTNKKPSKSKLSLEERLEQKVASGKANENFVRVNVQKKVYVRGKKTMTYSKFKKKQWKANKQSLYGKGGDKTGSGGVRKCFKCGDVGHFSRSCMKEDDKLLPQEEDDEDESPFPTLEEAEEMAKESAVRLNVKRNVPEILKVLNIEDDLVVEDADKLLVQPAEDLTLDSSVEPIFQLNEDGSLIDTPDIVFNTLTKFGHESFRPYQEQIIMRILSGLSTLVTLATGTGKSLCYQLPAYIYSKYRKSMTLVVSPLVSLMEDQVANSSSCLEIACLHGNQSKSKRDKVLERLKNNELQVLLVSPEAIVEGDKLGFTSFLRHLPPIAFACVDEAHCVSQWSHNFRPSYLTILQVLREKMGVKVILGLTATATRSTMENIASLIRISDGPLGIIQDMPLPDNLILSVSEEKNKDYALLTLLRGPRFSSIESIIVYCTRRQECDRVCAFLRTCLQNERKEEAGNKRGKLSINAEVYHAGICASRRRSVQNAFMSGKLRIVIATVAFGMGINKIDIRGIIHYNMPSAFESYVQEIGRAGRDGLPAYCHLFLDPEGRDLNELRRHIYANSTERHTIRKLLQRVFVPCQCKTTCPRHEVAFSMQDTVKALDLKEESISTLLCYLELHEQKWAKMLSPSYTTCIIHCYKGAKQLRKAAKECAPLAMAVAIELKKCKTLDKITKLQFNVYDVARAINWDSGMVKHHLKRLEWTTVNDKPKPTGLKVQFSDLGFHLQVYGNLNSDELDVALDSLYSRVEIQETTCLKKLQCIFQSFTEVSYKSVEECLEEVDEKRCDILKTRIRDYFSKENLLDNISLPKDELENEEQVVADIRSLICSYRDCSFTGRAIARIFHGIESPNFPAIVWYKCRFWRAYLDQNFNVLSKIATRELIYLR